MDRMRMESPDLTQRNIEAIGALFPNCVTETRGADGAIRRAINFDMLRQMLTDESIAGDEAYEFTWVGKKAAMVEASRPIRKTLRPCMAESRDWDETGNLYIEGHNLDVLKLLQESYLGKVKFIYIDPPYNGGKDRFVYNDRFTIDAEEYADQTGETGEDGEVLLRSNTSSNPRFHSAWCSMLYPLLLLSRSLMTEDGVIFISIDERENANLREMADEVFGAENYAGEIIWKSSSKNDEAYISTQHEYILCYVKNRSVNQGEWIEEKEGIDEIMAAFAGFRRKYGDDWEAIHKAALEWFKQFPESNPIYASKHYSWMDERGVYFPADISGPNFGQYRYNVIHPVTRKICKEPASGWRYPETTMKERIANGLVHFGKDETTIPNNKTYLAETLNQSLTSMKYRDGRVASKQLTALLGSNCFSNPKDISLLATLMKAIHLGDGDIVLDFFSGSATTAEAVMQVAVEKSIQPHFIMVQWPEDLDDNLIRATGSAVQITKNAIALCNTLHRPHLLTEIGKERIRRAGEKIKTDAGLLAQKLDIGFRVLKLDDSNMKPVYYSVGEYTQDLLAGLESNIREDRTDLDLLFGCLLEWGLPLSLPYTSERLSGCTVHTYNDGDLIACFDENVPEAVIREIASRHPLRAVFRDSSFASSPERINVEEIFKLLSPNTSVKVL